MCLIKEMFINIGKTKKENLNHSGRSYIGETLQIEGDLRSSGIVDIAGLINGNVYVEDTIVKETGSVRGHIEANTIEVNGHIEGQITATNIIIGKNAIIKGDIFFKNTLKTEEGADIDGYIKRVNNGKLKTEEDIAIEEIVERDERLEAETIPVRTHKEAV